MLHRRTALAVLGALMATLTVPVAAQENLEDARARREAVQAEAASAASKLDVLEAEDADIVEALDDIERWIDLQQARLATAEQHLATATETEALAVDRANLLDTQITDLEATVAEQSVNSYIGGFSNDDGLLLNVQDINTVPMLRFVLDESTGVSEATTDLLRAARSQQAEAVTEAEQASADAQQLRRDVQDRLAELEATRATQQQVRAEVERRIAELEEATTILEAEDAEIERFIQGELARIAAEEEARRQAEEEARIREEERVEAERRAAEAAEAEAAAQAAQEEQADQQDSEQPADTAPDDPATPGADETDAGQPEPAPSQGDGGAPTFVRPVSGGVSSGFGNRVHPVYGTQRMHTGFDFNAPSGAPIGAAADGSVIFAGPFSGYGNTVIVQHSGGYSSLYAHMSAFNVGVGANVSAGQTIGFIGSTGLSTGPHLHFEIRLDGAAIDPSPFL